MQLKKYHIVGPASYKRAGFKIDPRYRGLERTSFPDNEGLNQIQAMEFNHWFDKYTHEILFGFEEFSSDLLQISTAFSKISGENYEVIFICDVSPEQPEELSYEFLGFEVVTENEESVLFGLMNPDAEENHFQLYSAYLNDNYLFSNLDDAIKFKTDFISERLRLGVQHFGLEGEIIIGKIFLVREK